VIRLTALLFTYALLLSACSGTRVGPRVGVDLMASAMTDEAFNTSTTQSPNAIVGISIERFRRGAIGLRVEPSLRYIPVSTADGDPSLNRSIAAFEFVSTTTLFEVPIHFVLPVYSIDSAVVLRAFAGPTAWLPVAQTLRTVITQRVTVDSVAYITQSGLTNTSTEFGTLGFTINAGAETRIQIGDALFAVAGFRATYWPKTTILGAGGGLGLSSGNAIIARHFTPTWSFGVNLSVVAQL